MKSRSSAANQYSEADWSDFDGRVGGAYVDFYRTENANISMTINPLFSATMLYRSGGETELLHRTDVEALAYNTKVLGVGFGAGVSYTTDNTLEFNFDASIFFGAEITIKFGKDGNWLFPSFSGNTYATLETGWGVGAAGFGVGYLAGVRYDEGLVTASAYADLGVLGMASAYSIDLIDHDMLVADILISSVSSAKLWSQSTDFLQPRGYEANIGDALAELNQLRNIYTIPEESIYRGDGSAAFSHDYFDFVSGSLEAYSASSFDISSYDFSNSASALGSFNGSAFDASRGSYSSQSFADYAFDYGGYPAVALQAYANSGGGSRGGAATVGSGHLSAFLSDLGPATTIGGNSRSDSGQHGNWDFGGGSTYTVTPGTSGKIETVSDTRYGNSNNGSSNKNYDYVPGGSTDFNDKKMGLRPLLLDLDGDGISVSELGRSDFFLDADDDGFENRMAWAGPATGFCSMIRTI